jgi:hypothetical protein
MWARHQDKLGSDLEDMGRRRCYTFHELRKHHQSFLTLVATICGLAFEYFGLKHRKAAPTPVTTKRRRKKRRRTARR